jgi:cell wall assembly regulator SMI1
MRSTAASNRQVNENFENVTPGEIPMLPFQEGLPPPPPVGHSWKKIDAWAEEHYTELYDQLGEGCTNNDLNELEHQLDCSLPMEVRESLQIHDGQERGGIPTGIIFGCMLLDCEEIVQEWQNWKVVNQEYLTEPTNFTGAAPSRALGGSSSSSSKTPAQSAQNPMWRQDLSSRQDSQPAGAIQKVYAHPAWIPLARDWGGNNLAVDLAPGPTGKWGQVIIFGRDYDCKYVVARSWSAFLATVADDLKSGKWFVDEETNELKLREFKSQNVEPGYLNILRWRADQKYGRKNMKRRPTAPGAASSPAGSPYSSPTAEIGESRGRSMQRFSGASPVASPSRPVYGKPSPLARVAEETSAPIKIKTNVKPQKLVEVESPRPNDDAKQNKASAAAQPLIQTVTPATPADLDDNTQFAQNGGSEVKGFGLTNGSAEQTIAEDDSAMKTIEI